MTEFKTCAIREAELRKLLGRSRKAGMALVFQTLDHAGISTTHPSLINFRRVGNDVFFEGPPHKEG